MRELSLFSGAGGGLLGTHHLLGWECIGYVEWDEYCQRVLAARIRDGLLPRAPIFGDVRQFVQSGAAREYRGFADVVTAGFPCQPFSVAGKQRGADDHRNMWPATIATIRMVRPRYALLENVPGLLNSGYFGTIVRDLATCGYGVRWRILSAAELGAPHKRDRLWIVAHATGERAELLPERPRRQDEIGSRADVADAAGQQGGRVQFAGVSPDTGTSGDVRHTTGARLADGQREPMGGRAQGHSVVQPERPAWWEVEPDVGRLADGFPTRVAQLKAAGNAQVPAVAAWAWRLLTE